MSEQLDRFISLLKGIFELDKSDLDFGIYRIMNIRKKEIEKFLGDWQCMAAQSKPLVYYVGNKHLEKYNRLMNYYSEDCSRMEKGTLNSMREVEASATLFYWEE